LSAKQIKVDVKEWAMGFDRVTYEKTLLREFGQGTAGLDFVVLSYFGVLERELQVVCRRCCADPKQREVLSRQIRRSLSNHPPAKPEAFEKPLAAQSGWAGSLTRPR
jgi:hypothetical protein